MQPINYRSQPVLFRNNSAIKLEMKAQEIRDLSEKERQEKVSDLSQEIFNLRFQLATGKIENPSRLKSLRRDIARIKTIQREVEGDAPKNPVEEKKEEKK